MSNESYSVFDCPICLEKYIDPKALPCLHSFCKSCIGEYIKSTNIDKDSIIRFECPVCRQKIQLPTTDDPAESLPNNFLIKNLAPKTDSLPENTMACSVHKNKTVQFVCPDHIVAACTTCLLTNHRMCNVIEVSEAMDAKMIKEIKSKHLSLKSNLKSKILGLETEAVCYRSEIGSSKTGVKIFLGEVRNLLDKAEAKLIKQIEEEEKIYFHLSNKEISETTDILTDIETNIAIVTEIDNKTNEKSEQTCLNDFIQLKSIEDKMKNYETAIGNVDSYPLKRTPVHYKPNGNLSRLLKLEHPIGEIISFDVTRNLGNKPIKDAPSMPKATSRNKGEKQNKTKSRMSLVKSNEHQQTMSSPVDISSVIVDSSLPDCIPTTSEKQPTAYTLNLQTQSDKRKCFITGIDILGVNQIVVADQGNSKLKVFSERGRLISQQLFSSEPWSVCSINEGGIAVSFPSDNLIQYFNVRTNRILTRPEKISTNGRCYGLAVHNYKQIAVCVRRVSGSFASIYNDENELCKEIELSDSTSISIIWYIAFTSNGENIVFSDEEHNVISSVDARNGRLCWRQKISKPRGLAVLKSTIYVATNSCSTLKRFSESNGQSINEDVNLNKVNLNCITVNKFTGEVFVSQMSGGEVSVDSILNNKIL